MKKIIALILVLISFNGLFADITISKDDKFVPDESMVWMGMAVDEAHDNVDAKGLPCASVLVYNKSFRSLGVTTEKATSIETAIAMSRLSSLENTDIYTVNEPTSEEYNAICKAGADVVYFANPKEEVIKAGVYTAEDYDEAKIDTTIRQVTIVQVDCDVAKDLLKYYLSKKNKL